jgi:acetate kinase
MGGAILVINGGSSSIKFGAYRDAPGEELAVLFRGEIEALGTAPHLVCRDAGEQVLTEYHWPHGQPLTHEKALDRLLRWTEDNGVGIAAAGHRVVFGGVAHDRPLRVDDQILSSIDALVPFFPLHLPHNLAAIRALKKLSPALPQVACFDTSFHRTQPGVAQLFALPRRMAEQGIRRYGFHGLSYEYIARRLPEVVPGASRLVVAHLGSGCSMCAIRDGTSVESTLGFSGLDGLPMGTRCGPLDPGVTLYLLQALRMDPDAIEHLLYHESGLLGVSGISNDMRELMASADPRAAEAIDLFVYHLAKQLGALTAVLEGLDALVFTAGIGENAAAVRERLCQRAAWLGISFDAEANARGGPCITGPDSPVSVWVIPTDEERMIAMHTREVIGRGRPSA